jgi:hypothetical protein
MNIARRCQLNRVNIPRSSPSAHRSPLTRYPLGSRGARKQGGDLYLAPVEFRAGEIIGVSLSAADR